MIAVREAAFADAEAMAAIQVAGWDHAYSHLMSKEFRAARGTVLRSAEWRERLGTPNPGTAHLVADRSGEVVGIAGGGPRLDDEVIVEGDVSQFNAQAYGLYVAPALLGQGIGRQLLGELALRLAIVGNTSLVLWVFENNPYRRFYERLDGRQIARASWDIGEARAGGDRLWLGVTSAG